MLVLHDHHGAVQLGLQPSGGREQFIVLKIVRNQLHRDRQPRLARDPRGDRGGRDAGQVGRLRAVVQPGGVLAIVGEGEIRKSKQSGQIQQN